MKKQQSNLQIAEEMILRHAIAYSIACKRLETLTGEPQNKWGASVNAGADISLKMLSPKRKKELMAEIRQAIRDTQKGSPRGVMQIEILELKTFA